MKTSLFTLCLVLISSWASSSYADSRWTEVSKKWYRPGEISCTYNVLTLPSSPITSREVKYQLPLGTPPAEGWPVVMIYQGTAFPVEFTRNTLAPFGGFYEVDVIKTLLDNGYAVLAPRAPVELAWLTNSAGPLTNYPITTDYEFLGNVLQAVKDGDFGPLNPNRQYATGISSGGYNTSRMAVSFPGEFKALAIQSASYATCLGPVCVVPFDLPNDHPPTYFLHGFLDAIVPWWSMDIYYDRLNYEGIETERYTDYFAGHEWLPQSAPRILNWFNNHP